MSFHESSDNIRIEVRDDRTILFANANNYDGEACEAILNLDDVIGNSDGKSHCILSIINYHF